MSLFKCKMCGGSLDVPAGSSVIECEYCGTQQTLPKLDDEKRTNMYDRANHFRRNNEFDKAMSIYEQILNEDKTDAEAYWSLVLCRYGIEYVEDPSTHRRIPTVNRAQFTSILADEDYKSALANSDTYQRSIYELEAKTIDEIQKGILAISNKEDPFDVFICYKETDNNGRRTLDSVLAQELYYGLKNEGFKVFFARITLEDKLGSAYEPYIFAALNSAKVMVVLGTKPEFFNSVWVKNEWSRYLALIKQGHKKMLIPAYKDMDPYDLPEEFSHLQAQDMSKLGFMQDLIRGIKKIAGKEKKEPVKETVIVNQINQDHNIAPMLKRAFLFLEDGDFDSADEYAEKVLDIDPECSDAYIIKLLIDLKLRSASQINSHATPIDRNPNYIKALRFAKRDARNKIEGYNQAIVERIDLENKKQQYAAACSLMNARKYDEAIAAFSKIKTFKDSVDKIEACKQNKETDRKEAIYATALRDVASSSADDKVIKKSIAALESIKGYKDADKQIEKLQARLEKWYEDQKAADERARIKAEQDKLEAARQAELRKIKAEQNKKKAIKIAKIIVPSLVALVLVVILTVTLFIPMIRFNKADKLFAEGKYDEANRIYQELDGFGDSNQRISTVKAIDLIEDKKFEDGIKTLLAAGVPVELTYQTEGGSLTETQTLMVGHTLSLDNSVVPLSTEETVTTASEQNVFTFNQSSDFAGLKTPGRNGYRFLEWVLGAYAYDVDAKDAKFCLMLKATWSTKDYVVEYDLAGGSLSSSNVAEYDPEDEAFTLINPTRTGYTFAGWTGTDLPGPTMEVIVYTGSYGDRSYTATWTANEYTVTYDAAGGTVSSETQKVYYDSNAEYLIPEREGCFKFIGWYDNDVLCQNGKWTFTNNLSLTAKWEITCADADKDHYCDECEATMGLHTDRTNDGNHVCDYGCGVTLTNCNDLDKDHNCDECRAPMGTHADSANDGDHICDYGCGEILTSCDGFNNDHICDECLERVICIDSDIDFLCDIADCDMVVIPEADSVLTVEKALALASLLGENDFTANKYFVTGIVTSVPNAANGSLDLTADNRTIYVYYVYDATGANKYDAMANKPIKGDAITVYGVIGNYNGSSEMKNAWVTNLVPHGDNHTYSEGICTICGDAEPVVGATTVAKTIADVAIANSWKSGNQYTSIALDYNITATVSGGHNSGKYYRDPWNSDTWRLYQSENPSITIAAADGKTIVYVKISYIVDLNGVLTQGTTLIASDEFVFVNANSVVFGVGNTGSYHSGKVGITAIEVIYK